MYHKQHTWMTNDNNNEIENENEMKTSLINLIQNASNFTKNEKLKLQEKQKKQFKDNISNDYSDVDTSDENQNQNEIENENQIQNINSNYDIA